MVAMVVALLALPSLGATARGAPISNLIIGEIERITINNPSDMFSGGKMVVGGQNVILPRNLLIDLPANRLTLKQLFDQAPADCVARGETGLAKADVCNASRVGGIANARANRTNAGDAIAGDLFVQKGTEAISGPVTYINYANGYFRVGGTLGDSTTGIMVRLNDPVGRHTVQQGPDCPPGSPNCSPDPRFTLDPDNYTAAFSTGYPLCIPSTVPRVFADVLDLDNDGNTTETLTAQSAADGTGDILCPITNRTLQPVDDSRRFAPILLGDSVTVEGNFETINGVHFISTFAVTVSVALATKNLPNQPDYFIFDEVFIDVPGFNNQRVRTMFIGYMSITPTDVLIWSLHRDNNNVPHEFPLATSTGCDNASGLGTCTAQGLVAGGAAGNIFKIKHDVDFLAGADAKSSPCAHLRADSRFASLNPCPAGGTPAEMFAVLSPAPHEIIGRTGRKVADLARQGGPLFKTLDITGQNVPNGQYLFPFGIGLGGLSIPEFVEIDLNALGTATIFEGLPWLLDARLGPGGCDGPCGATPRPLDPFPFSSLDPRNQAALPTGSYNDPVFTASSLNNVRDRVLSFVDAGIGKFNGNATLLPLSLAVDPPSQGMTPTPSLFPSVTTVSPANGATNVAVVPQVTATFSEDMDPFSLNTTTFTLVRQGTTTPVPAAVTYNTATRVATLVPGASLESGIVYTATVKSGAAGSKALTSFPLAADRVWAFTTTTVDSILPTVTAVSPVDGATGVATSSQVTATFSEAIDTASLSTTTFTLIKQGTTTPVPAAVSYNAATRVATLTPSASLESGVAYTATVKSGATGAKDLAGNPLALDRVWAFTTVDTVAPTVLAVLPGDGATGVAINSQVIAIFSESMDPASLSTTAFTLIKQGTATPVPAAVSYNAATRVATLAPSASLEVSAAYNATVKGGVSGGKDLAGNPLAADMVWSFTTIDTSAPTVTSVSPSDGATGIAVTFPVTATFSEAMDPASLSTNTFTLIKQGTTTPVAAVISYNTATRVATLVPGASLETAVSYTATIKGGATGVKDVAGNPIILDKVWSFTTLDNIPPTVTSVSPADGVTGVTATSQVSATFSEAMDPASLSTTTFTLVKQGTTAPVPAAVSYNAATRVATLAPSASLESGVAYTATVKSGATGAKDLTGNPLAADRIWAFTTVDNIPPTVTSVSPSDGATGVASTSQVSATFSEAMDPASLSTTTFTLIRQGTTTPVPAAVSYNAAIRVATLTPSASLEAGVAHTATVKSGASGAKDLTGNSLSVDKVWSFTILPNNPPIAVISSPANGVTFLITDNINFNGSLSSDPNGDILTFEWSSSISGVLGNTVTLNRQLAAGNHSISLKASDGKGGVNITSVSITVKQQKVLDVTWGSHNTPNTIKPGQMVGVPITLTNTGTQTWPKGGVNPVYVTYHWYNSSGQPVEWGIGLRSSLSQDVPSGQSASLTASLKSPSTPGSYNLLWDMVHEGVSWFSAQGAPLLAVSGITVAANQANDVQWVSHNTPATMGAGQQVNVSIALTNTGSQVWPSGGANPVRVSYHWLNTLGQVVVWDGLKTSLTNNVSSGQLVNLSASLQAPATAGNYTLMWDILVEGVGWFSGQGAPLINITGIVVQ